MPNDSKKRKSPQTSTDENTRKKQAVKITDRQLTAFSLGLVEKYHKERRDERHKLQSYTVGLFKLIKHTYDEMSYKRNMLYDEVNQYINHTGMTYLVARLEKTLWLLPPKPKDYNHNTSMTTAFTMCNSLSQKYKQYNYLKPLAKAYDDQLDLTRTTLSNTKSEQKQEDHLLAKKRIIILLLDYIFEFHRQIAILTDVLEHDIAPCIETPETTEPLLGLTNSPLR